MLCPSLFHFLTLDFANQIYSYFLQALRAKDALQESASTVGINDLLNDDVMRKAVLATHRTPLKKRKDRDDVIIMDLDRQENEEHVVDLTIPSEGGVLENREGSNKFTFHVN